MFRTFNMGIGFCVIVPPADSDALLGIIGRSGLSASVIGRTVADNERLVTIPAYRLRGRGHDFHAY
jgi:phosphoribosylformylglycinamidine cyclo-ligase